MNKRYELIKRFRSEHWLDGSPILMMAHALVKDNAYGTVLALCKFGNLSCKSVDALYIKISCIGADGEPVEGIDEHVYLDLAAGPGTYFGEKMLITLPDRTTRRFTVIINKVVFTEGPAWINEEHRELSPLPAPQPLSILGHLREQYRRDFPEGLQTNLPEDKGAYWRCGCGQINLREAAHCIKCGHDLKSQILASEVKELEKKLLAHIEKKKEQERLQALQRQAVRLKVRKILMVVIPVLCISIVLIVSYKAWLSSDLRKYKVAVSLLELGSFDEAIEIFEELDDYKDSANKLEKAIGALAEKHRLYLETHLEKYGGSMIAAGNFHTVAVMKDGKVLAVGGNMFGECNLSNWSDIINVAAGFFHTVGIRSDGKVVAVGRNEFGECDVSDWSDIVFVSAGCYHTVALKSDGTVVAVGRNKSGECDVSDWSDISAVVAGAYHTVGLRSDGTIVAVGKNKHGELGVSDWSNMAMVAAGEDHTVGLRSDGTVVATGSNQYGQCDVSDWSGIVAVAAGLYHTTGIRSDGTVVAAGRNQYGQCDVSNWSGVIGISAGYCHTVGLSSGGKVVAVGRNNDNQCNVSGWQNIKTNQ